MKNLRRLSVALVFTLTLTISAFAGEMDTGFAPPTTANGDIQTPLTGQMDTLGSSEATATGSATEIALSLLQSVLSLF